MSDQQKEIMDNLRLHHGVIIRGEPLVETGEANSIPGGMERGAGRGPADKYVDDVARILNSIAESRTGGVLLRFIHTGSSHCRIMIGPDLPPEPADSLQTRIFFPEWGKQLDEKETKWTFCAYGKNADRSEVLFHELVHGYRRLSGFNNAGTVPHWGNYEEFFAITITNMYSSELGRRLRAGCLMPDPFFDPGNPDVESFVRNYRYAFNVIINQNAFFCKDLATLSVPFNPFSKVYGA